jgi:predicted NAD/FAD-binding protein
MRIAVIGTGIAGNAAAWTLSQRYPVTVYERDRALARGTGRARGGRGVARW